MAQQWLSAVQGTAIGPFTIQGPGPRAAQIHLTAGWRRPGAEKNL
jgi:hypothetical protein